ncbi:GerAB/ArcD/ProY family transporter [Paenibacillus beijingensis]|uniref:GerAB/ArcD/ProY family transporter n=1 Tax=Paenibacillus beijingensis TaxID=1126833 RepID=UPI000698BCBE|nr:GerAB/ArcD/ProY family transporter [Paenibacillus beijingensis]
MKEKAKIGAYQLFCLLVTFELGTALVVPLGVEAKQGAWLAILLGMAGGLLLFALYVYLFRQHPDMPLTAMIQLLLGKFIGWPVALLYVVFFIYAGSRDLRDVASLLISANYSMTPMMVISTLILFAVAYVIDKGIEVLARTAEIMFASLAAFGVLELLLVLFSDIIDLHALQPVLGEGWMPVLKQVVSQTVMFPYGEAVCFLMIFPYLNKSGQALKTTMTAALFGGLVFTLTALIELAVLGVNLTSRSTFPLLTAISKVSIGEFIQRTDAIAVFSLIVTDFMKLAVFYYAAALGAAQLFSVRSYRVMTLPIGLIIMLASLAIASTFSEHFKEGGLVLKTVYPVYALFIPLLLALIASIRSLRNPARKSPEPQQRRQTQAAQQGQPAPPSPQAQQAQQDPPSSQTQQEQQAQQGQQAPLSSQTQQAQLYMQSPHAE